MGSTVSSAFGKESVISFRVCNASVWIRGGYDARRLWTVSLLRFDLSKKLYTDGVTAQALR